MKENVRHLLDGQTTKDRNVLSSVLGSECDLNRNIVDQLGRIMQATREWDFS